MSKVAQSTFIRSEVIKLLRQVESDIWYKTATFVMVNKNYKSNFLEVLMLVDRKTDEMSRNECLFVL